MITTKTPTISVIIPTYNRAHILRNSIKSVLDQTYRDLELIIVDDGSKDNTTSVVKEFSDSRIRLITHPTNKGAASAINTGIRVSRGNFITFLGSDDKFLPKKLEKEIDILINSDRRIGVVYTGLCQLKNGKKFYMPFASTKREGNITKELLKGNFVNGLSLIRKECFEKVGLFDETLPALEDWDIFIRISKYYEFRFINELLIIAPLSEDSISVNSSKILKAHLMIFRKHQKDFNRYKESLSSIYSLIGSWYCIDGQSGEGIRYFIKAIKIRPFVPNYYLALFSALFGSKFYKKVFEMYKNFN